MKRALALALVCVMGLGLAAFAGPYFVIENVGVVLQPGLVVGWDFEAKYIDSSNLSVTGDFHAASENLLMYPNPWIGGFDIGLSWRTIERSDVFAVDLSMDVVTTPLPWPAYVELDTWTTGITFTGKPNDIVTIWGTAEFVYALVNPPGPPGWVGVWTFIPTIGLECYW